MRRLWSKFIGLWVMVSVLMPELVLAAGAKVGGVVIVADSRRLTGIMAWWANLYNESHFWFMVLTVVLIPVIGVLFGTIADIVMSHIGIDLKSRELAEH